MSGVSALPLRILTSTNRIVLRDSNAAVFTQSQEQTVAQPHLIDMISINPVAVLAGD
jgi:hypothetical protein